MTNRTEHSYNRKISKRIEGLVSLLPSKSITFDLCCDHGLIGYHAYTSGMASEVVFVDQVESITSALKKRISDHTPDKPFSVLTSDACDVVLPNESINIIIAGVYANTVLDIVKSHIEHREDDHYVLSPNSDHASFEKNLDELGVLILKKTVVEENSRNYPIYLCKKKPGKTWLKTKN